MTTPSQVVLKANALIYSEETNKFICFICVFDTISKGWKTHIEKSSHVAALERYCHTFDDGEDGIVCKICKSPVERDMIKKHAKSHMIVPWYEPVDKFKIFYENHTLKFSSNYYCHLCDEIFQDWFTAYTHIGYDKHQSIVQGIHQSVPTRGSKKFYIELISNGFVPGVEGVECRFCDKTNLSYHTTAKHTNGFSNHTKNKSKFIERLSKRSDYECATKRLDEFTEYKESTSKKNQAANNVSKSANRSMICNFFLDRNSPSSDVDKNAEATVERVVEKTEAPNWIEEVPELFHEYNDDYIVSNTNALVDAAKAKNNKKKRQIAKQITDDPDPYCLLCCIEINGPLAIDDHLTSERHASSRRRYGCDDVVRIENNLYYCASCDRTIIDFDNVYHHVLENSHVRSIDTARTEFIVEEISRATEMTYTAMEIPREANKSHNQSCIYVVRRNAKKSFCHICDDAQYPVATKNVKDHIDGQRHKLALVRYGCENIVAVANVYRCRCCDVELSSLENVYLHVKDKSHINSMIKVSHNPNSETQTRKSMRDKFDYHDYTDEANKQHCRNLLSDYIVNQIPLYSSNDFTELAEPAPVNDLFVGQNWNPKRFEPQRPFEQPNYRNSFGNNNTEQSASTSSFWEFPNRVKTSRQSMHPDQSAVANSYCIREDETPIKKVYCNICDDSVDDMTQLHVHMANHFNDEFVRPKKNRYTNGIMNERNAPNSVERSHFVFGPRIDEHVFNVDHSPSMNGVQNGNNVPINVLNFTTSEFGPNVREEFDPKLPPAQNNGDPPKKHHSPKIANMKKIVELLDFNKNHIYDMQEKLAEIELGMRLCLNVSAVGIYCLICRKIVDNDLSNYYEHLCSVDHCNYLETMEQDFELFEHLNGQFSDLDLAQEYMQEISDEIVRCFICDCQIFNSNEIIESHIFDEEHSRRCDETRARSTLNFQNVKSRLTCDWYQVQKYWCVVCLMNTDSEVNFVKHLESEEHQKFVNKSANVGKRLIFDFCAPCALLWYGYRSTYSYHSDIASHKWLTRDGHFVSAGLSRSAKSLLAEPEVFIDSKVKYLDEICQSERLREERLIDDMERAVRMKFPRAKAYTFGSRVSGLASPDSDIDVYLDCRNTYDGNDTSESQILFFMTGVHQCLSKEATSWDVEELLTNCRSPIIRAYHRQTGLNCDISFQNGLSVENTKLIKIYNNVFPTCRKLILFLKQWLDYCDCAASDRITNYALYWYVIFYLQKETILPSVATLIAMSKKSRTIDGWEVGVSQNFTYNQEESNYSIKEYLMRFFKFYVNFNFRHCVACPLLGEELTKKQFVEPENLPEAMSPYVDYMKKNSDKHPEPFRIDSAMCIQDPFDLQHNLTKAVSKVYLNRFRTCCSRSLDLLCSNV